MAGYSNITGGDDRYYNNIFLGDNDSSKEPVPITFLIKISTPLIVRTRCITRHPSYGRRVLFTLLFLSPMQLQK
jgi:hypothetical protein